VTFYISALEILLLTYLLTYLKERRGREREKRDREGGEVEGKGG